MIDLFCTFCILKGRCANRKIENIYMYQRMDLNFVCHNTNYLKMLTFYYYLFSMIYMHNYLESSSVLIFVDPASILRVQWLKFPKEHIFYLSTRCTFLNELSLVEQTFARDGVNCVPSKSSIATSNFLRKPHSSQMSQLRWRQKLQNILLSMYSHLSGYNCIVQHLCHKTLNTWFSFAFHKISLKYNGQSQVTAWRKHTSVLLFSHCIGLQD